MILFHIFPGAEEEGFEEFKRTPFRVNDGGLKTQLVNFQFLANSGGMENKL